MKIKLLLVTVLGFAFTACTSPISPTIPNINSPKSLSYESAPASKVEVFDQKKRQVGLSTKNDPKYNSFGPELTTEAKKHWFNDLMYRLWDRQITRNQFVAEGVTQFPAHKYEFSYIANGF